MCLPSRIAIFQRSVLALTPSLRKLESHWELTCQVFSLPVPVYTNFVSVLESWIVRAACDFNYGIKHWGRLDASHTLASGWNCPGDWCRETRHEGYVCCRSSCTTIFRTWGGAQEWGHAWCYLCTWERPNELKSSTSLLRDFTREARSCWWLQSQSRVTLYPRTSRAVGPTPRLANPLRFGKLVLMEVLSRLWEPSWWQLWKVNSRLKPLHVWSLLSNTNWARIPIGRPRMIGLVVRLLLKLSYTFTHGTRGIPRIQETSIAWNSTRIRLEFMA